MTGTDSRVAFGKPGTDPRWTGSAKDGVGTAYSASSTVWYTISRGILNELYYPTVDRPQTRDLQFLITDGKTFVHDEKRDLEFTIKPITLHALGFEIVKSDPEGRYKIRKEVIGNPHQNAVLIKTRLEGNPNFLKSLKLYVLLAPHLNVGGWGNNGRVMELAGRKILTAQKGNVWLAMGASVPFSRCSCGYVGTSDGWTDVMRHKEMRWEFDAAPDGNIALTGELDLSEGFEFKLAVAFGDTLHNVATVLFQSLDIPFEDQRRRFVEQWDRSERHVLSLDEMAQDGGCLYHMSHSLLAAHEDKTYQGAMIASLSVPWGNAHGDDDIGGYHLVWTRDMCNSASGLMAAGNAETARRALVYLACTQTQEGGFYQNFWINGEPNWRGVQLDETAFPIMLAWRLRNAGALGNFDPYPMVRKAAEFLIKNGPATQQERWEENSGFSPSTLAAHIAGLTCAALFAALKGDASTARFVQEYADFLESHVEKWTVTTQGTLVPGIPRHYIRILPASPDNPDAGADPNNAVLAIRNLPPGSQTEFPAKEIVDAGFLELVRYGIRKPADPLIEDSLQVVDAFLKVETPLGVCWKRYNHDGYGQREDGGPFVGFGKGRAWPLLTGERGHYELAAGRDPIPFIKSMEGFAQATGLLPEQIWDEKDLPQAHMYFGKPTGSAMPLMWAHAEYIKLLRSARDKQIFDLIPQVTERYMTTRKECARLEIWKFNYRPLVMQAGLTLRVIAPAPFVLHWSADGWQTRTDTRSTATHLNMHYADIPTHPGQHAPLTFTFYWPEAGKWEGEDFKVTPIPSGASDGVGAQPRVLAQNPKANNNGKNPVETLDKH